MNPISAERGFRRHLCRGNARSLARLDRHRLAASLMCVASVSRAQNALQREEHSGPTVVAQTVTIPEGTAVRLRFAQPVRGMIRTKSGMIMEAHRGHKIRLSRGRGRARERLGRDRQRRHRASYPLTQLCLGFCSDGPCIARRAWTRLSIELASERNLPGIAAAACSCASASDSWSVCTYAFAR